VSEKETGSSGPIPQPEDIYLRTKEEGERRLQRPVLEEMSTALAAGFDIVAGILALALVQSQLEHLMGRHAAHVFGSMAFGTGFVFLVVGRGELFTENFLVPIAGLDRRDAASWRNLFKLWTISPLFNVLAGLVLALILSVHSVLPFGTGRTLQNLALTIHANGMLALFMSAVFAGALITAMTWFVEGQTSMIVRVVVAWFAGFLLAVGNSTTSSSSRSSSSSATASARSSIGRSSSATSCSRQPATSSAASDSSRSTG
jgi:formate-nitrite transporter family protein